MSDGALRAARALVVDAKRVVVLTGAGVSAESGVPTFRGAGGLWKSYRPEELATPQAFRRDPGLVWEWYAWRRGLIAACRPNPAHDALAALCLDRAGDALIVTQNVDGLHHRAAREVAEKRGVPPDPAFPLEVHGAIHRDRCSGCDRRTPAIDDADASRATSLPRCNACGEALRPDVVWFGEALDGDTLGAAFEAADRADVCLVVGTSALVHPAASVPEATIRAGGALVEVNPEPTPLSRYATVSLRGTAGELVPNLLA